MRCPGFPHGRERRFDPSRLLPSHALLNDRREPKTRPVPSRCPLPDTGVVGLRTTSCRSCAVLAAVIGARPELVVWQTLVPVGVLLAVVDFAVHRLPDIITLISANAKRDGFRLDQLSRADHRDLSSLSFRSR